ncbi:hypothetical protein A11A3_00185 [Alcanivorax hongdengensis A-11-3]|uniref:DUF2946 domain-containing protein n=1 Tax=Alcanivorax hongdengensis A-11-3 TaxID=1177179 RepID=L0WJ47_9GAMM|nr:hypothetical protein [Alcanivorax hongdengensis]EKF75865.1 hypothetical protein A11A3_00185 [Alcanivorax hongdengensis A-11-3]
MTTTDQRRLALWLAGIVFLAQLIFAWHSPSHINAGKGDHSKAFITAADCQICAHGHGLVGLPSQAVMPVPPTHVCLGESCQAHQPQQHFHLARLARGPPVFS